MSRCIVTKTLWKDELPHLLQMISHEVRWKLEHHCFLQDPRQPTLYNVATKMLNH